MPSLEPLPPMQPPPATLTDSQFRNWATKALVTLEKQNQTLNANLQTIYDDTQRTIALLTGEE